LWYLRFIFIPRETKNSSDSNFSLKYFKYKVTHSVTELRNAVPLTSVNINCQLFYNFDFALWQSAFLYFLSCSLNWFPLKSIESRYLRLVMILYL